MSKHQDGKKYNKKSSKKSKKHSDTEHRKYDLPKGVNPINEEDFFLKATEFRVWIQQKRDLYLDDLSNEEATSLFKSKFVKRWNEGKLDKMYYGGIPDDVIEATKRTRHKWTFISKLSEKEQFELATTKDSVDAATKKTSIFRHEKPNQMNFDDHRHSTVIPRDEEGGHQEWKRYHRLKEKKNGGSCSKETGG